MTPTSEIEPETQRAIEGKAARLGVLVERYAADVLRSVVESDDAREPQGRISARWQVLAVAQGLAKGTREGLPPIPDEASCQPAKPSFTLP